MALSASTYASTDAAIVFADATSPLNRPPERSPTVPAGGPIRTVTRPSAAGPSASAWTS